MIIKDELHGTIEFDELETKIIDSAEFQRLRRIKQMSVAHLVYPGANHTRFEHSLGTAHLASLIASKLGLDFDYVKKVKLYALLHDIGHVAFSHEAEDILKKYIGDHERLGKQKILKGEITDLISENYRPAEIADIKKSKYGAIVTSDLGADRMDYLKRDALNTGVAYGIIDIDRIMHTLLWEEDELVISDHGLEAAEYLLIARFMMFSTIYLHKTVRIATAMLHRAIQESIRDKTLLPSDFISLTDEAALSVMSRSKKAGKYAAALLTRNLYKEVCSFPIYALSINRCHLPRLSPNQLELLIREKINCDVIIDYPHAFFKPVSFRVKSEAGLVPISELSSLVKVLKKSEEERMKVLVLAGSEDRRKYSTKIEELVASSSTLSS